MKINFYLDRGKKNKQGRIPVRLHIHTQGVKARPGARLAVLEQFWDEESQRVTKEHPNAKLINANLSKLELDAEAACLHLQLQRTRPTEELLIKLIFPEEEKPADVPKNTLPENLIALYPVWKEINSHLAYETHRKFQQVVTHLEEFYPDASIDSILDIKWTNSYKRKLEKLELSNTTIVTHFNYFRAALKTHGRQHLLPYLKVGSGEVDQLDLYKDEIQQLIAYNPSRKELQEEKDVFLFEIMTGLRDSDMRKLKPLHLKMLPIPGRGEVPVINKFQSKSVSRVVIPLPPMAYEIWQKYEGNLPVKFHNQQRNDYIKLLAKEAGLDRVFLRVKISGRKIIEKPVPVYKKISTHTARHTCGSRLLEVTRDMELCKYILGHGKRNVTSIYSKENPVHVVPLILDAWEKILS